MLERLTGAVSAFRGYANSAQARSAILSTYPNLLVNGDFQCWQRGVGPHTSATTFVNNDDAYLADNWNFLAEGSDTCDVSQETTVIPTGGVSAIKLDVETANRKFGIAQFVEAANSRGVIGRTVSLSFKARVTGTSISNIRAAVISWSSTADTVTSDVVSVWGAAGTNPTLVANWTYENTPANLAVTTSYTTFVLNNIAIDTASTANVGVFIWVDDTDATVADFLYITDVNLEPGAYCTTTFHHSDFQTELARCQRYIAGFTAPTSSNIVAMGAGESTTTTIARVYTALPRVLRGTPTLATSTIGDFFLRTAGGDTALTALALVGASGPASSVYLAATVASGLTVGRGVVLIIVPSAAGIAIFSAEL